MSKKIIIILIIIAAILAAALTSYLVYGRTFFNQEEINYYNQANQELENKEYSNAIENYEKALALNPADDIKTQIYLKKGAIHELKKDFEKAEENYKSALGINESDQSAILALSKLQLKLGKYQDILANSSKLTEDDATTILAKAHIAHGEDGEATRLLTDKQTPEAFYLQGFLNLIDKDTKKARDNFEQAASSAEENLKIKIDKILPQLAILESEDNQVYYFGLTGKLANDLLEPEIALISFQKALEFLPDYRDALVGTAYAYSQRMRYADAEKAISLAIKHDSVYGFSHFLSGKIYFAQEKYDQAIVAYQKAIKLGYKSEDLYYDLGLSYQGKGDYESACESYKETLELNDKYYLAYLQSVNCYLNELNDTQEAENVINQLKEAATENQLNLVLESWLLVKQGQLENAAEKLEESSESQKNFPVYYYVKNLLEKEKGDQDKAAENYTKAIDKDLTGTIKGWR